jgi:hypothetical protein
MSARRNRGRVLPALLLLVASIQVPSSHLGPYQTPPSAHPACGVFLLSSEHPPQLICRIRVYPDPSSGIDPPELAQGARRHPSRSCRRRASTSAERVRSMTELAHAASPRQLPLLLAATPQVRDSHTAHRNDRYGMRRDSGATHILWMWGRLGGCRTRCSLLLRDPPARTSIMSSQQWSEHASSSPY